MYVLMVLVSIAMSGYQGPPPGQRYTLPYDAEPGNREAERDLRPVKIEEARVAPFVRLAREAARAAAVQLSGRDLDRYAFRGGEHPVDVSVSENAGYYQVMLVPVIVESSHNVAVTIRKSDRKIIRIVRGG